ncbi:MAG: hypothetical protein K0Q73_9289 [Paenibacillus sp.]|jgi:hypothetical protein|nr:hypothetical protein [Paenibacillus sp.]
MKWNELKAMLEQDPIGSTIYNVEDDAMHLPHDDFYNGRWHLGVVLVPTDDQGLMMIPYTASDPNDGYEILELDLAEPIDVAYVEQAIAVLRTRADDAEKLLNQYVKGVDKQTAVPS